MSTPKKPRGTIGPIPELTKLKLLWRDTLPEKSRDFWFALFCSATTQAQIRAQLKSELGVNLTRDQQLTEFRSWLDEQASMDRESERQFEEETRLRQLHPDWDAERLRSEVIAGSLRRAMASGDFAGLGMKAVAAGQKEVIITLDRDKFELLRRKADQADATGEALDNDQLTPQQREQRIREIYGRA